MKRIGRDWIPDEAGKVQPKKESDDNWASIDDLSPLNDVCTKWCTRKYFPTAVARVNMVANVIRLFDRLRELTDLRFRVVFKGGVMIRLVLLECFSDLPSYERETLLAYLAENKTLSVSDFDFEIIPENHDSPSGIVHRFFTMDYAILLWLQNEMAREVARARTKEDRIRSVGLLNLDWDVSEGERELRDSLQAEVQKITNTSAYFYKASIDHVVLGDGSESSHLPTGYVSRNGSRKPSKRKNVCIFDCEETKCVMSAHDAFDALGVQGVPALSGGSEFYATLNTYIGEGEKPERTEHKLGLFHLARIKHAFVVFYTTRDGNKRFERLGGEMVDLSQSHGTSHDAMRRNMYESVPEPYRDYPILGTDPNIVVLHSYTIEGFLFDHAAMVFHTKNDPWDINKGSKRYLRYLSFLVAHVMGPNTPGSAKTKRRALRLTLDALRNVSSSGTTGMQATDEFLSALKASIVKAKAGTADAIHVFVKTMHSHLGVLFAAVETAAQKRWRRPLTILDATQLQYLRRHIRK